MNSPNLNPASVLNRDQEQLIYKVVQAILTPAQKGECRCHWLDADKTPILLWKSTKDPDTYILKISTQKFIGLTRSDKKSETYWKFKNSFDQVPQSGSTGEPPLPQKEPQEINKEVGVKINLPPQESDHVANFREKYGTSDNPNR